MVLLFAIAAGTGVFGSNGDESVPKALALDAVGSGDGAGEARVIGGGERLDLKVRGLSANAENEVYEVWLLTTPADPGLARYVSGRRGRHRGRSASPYRVDISRYESIDVSREPLDGDPSHSSDSVLRGATA